MSILSEQRARTVSATPSRSLRYLPASAFLLDLTIISACTVIAVLGRKEFGFFDNPADVSAAVAVAGPFIAAGWLLVLLLFGAYDKSVFGDGTDEFKRVTNSTLIAAALVGVGCYILKAELSRGFFVLVFGLALPLLLLGRGLLRRTLHSARRRGALRHRVLIAGSPSHVDEIAGVLQRESWLGYQVVGCLTPAHDVTEETRLGVPVLGNSDEATSVVLDSGADVVFFAGGALSSANQMRKVVWDLEHHDVQVVVAPSVTDISSERVRVRPVGGLPLIHIDPPAWSDASRWGKRTFDMVGSGGLILAFTPLFLIAALRIWVFDRGPIFFRQTRIGKDGQPFGCFKFRTMVVNAEAMVAKLQEELGQSALLFKMKDDPRITKPGRWLRRFSVDELPQLFNVFRGDMSLIGPRPQVAREVELYDNAMSRRLHVRPGMTGLWQVSGRNDLSPEEAIRLDLYYVDNWSMVQDLSILARTFGAVFSSRGAY
ncbi:MAG TPA: sugar transferase [Nocardioides sp.]|uniref:sugar transferase n=1 Tax=Nocardioides sp. TaxID=35761 RepID=UPI002C1AECC9|nr:sugar transferase [Nocardioides sp.]HTW17511.1 sugar transferase [Nocardioides sp.]